MNSSKALFVTYENPYTCNSGDSIYTVNIIETLLALKLNIDLIYFDSNETQPLIPDDIQPKFGNIVTVNFKNKNPLWFILSNKPGMIINRESQNYTRALEELIAKNDYDYIFVNHQKMIFTLSSILANKKTSEIIYCSHNAEYLLSKNNATNSKSLIRRIVYWQDAIKMKRYEKKWLHKFDATSAICEFDQEYYLKELNLANVHIIRPFIEPFQEKTASTIEKDFKEIVIVGSFDWGPKTENLLKFLEAKNFDLLHANGFNITIVGKSNQDLVNTVNKNFKGVHMTGSVPDVVPYYERAKISIIPEKLGGGFKLKVAEAAFFNTSIFAIKGAITKCNFIKEEHYKEYDSFEKLITGVLNSISNQEQLKTVVDNAYKLTLKDHTPKAAMNNMQELLTSLKKKTS